MSLLEELLSPIEGDAPAGPEARSSNEFSAIERAFLDADQPALMTPAGVEEDQGGEEFEKVVELATEFLQGQSKDLKVAVFLTVSLLRVEGFSGMATGLQLIKGLMEGYWDGLHPGIPNRAPILDWMGSDDVSFALYLVPLTEFGHRYTDYKEWAKEEAAGGTAHRGENPAEGGQDFGSGFGQTPREWYEGLCAGLERCSTALEELDAFGRERFQEAGEKPPRYSSLADALKRVRAAGTDLLSRKPAPPKPKVEPEAPEEMTASPAPVAATNEGSEPSAATFSGEPRSVAEAAVLVASAARVLRRERPADPSGYLLPRALRWGEIRAEGDYVNPRLLEAPATEERTRLKSLFLDKRFQDVLELAEEIVTTPVGRGWLDLQRYSLLSMDRLGQDYRQPGAAVRSALASLLRDVPTLVESTLMDDSPTASRDTLAWLNGEGLLPGDASGEEREERSRTVEAGRVIREAGFERAAAMARAGDPEGAVEMLMERAEHEASERARFIAKAEAAGIMVNYDMSSIARPILDELLEIIDKHQLQEWEQAEVVAKPMGLLLRCLDAQREGPLRQKLYPRLAKLDPLLAMRVNKQAGAGPAGGSSSDPSQPASRAEPVEESKARPGGPTPMPITPIDPSSGGPNG